MLSRRTHPTSSRARLAGALALLALALPLAAGCGGGGGQGQTATDKGQASTTETAQRKPRPRAPVGGAVSSFSAQVVSADRAQLTVTLKSPQPLVMRVNRVQGDNTTKVGKVTLGRKPSGRSVIPWDLRVQGQKLSAGRYALVMRAARVGRSRPVTISVPG